ASLADEAEARTIDVTPPDPTRCAEQAPRPTPRSHPHPEVSPSSRRPLPPIQQHSYTYSIHRKSMWKLSAARTIMGPITHLIFRLARFFQDLFLPNGPAMRSCITARTRNKRGGGRVGCWRDGD